jgi:hypothetical protein
MRRGTWIQTARILSLAAALTAGGCGGAPQSTAPKTADELTEREKQQIRELNQQRAEEWGTKK